MTSIRPSMTPIGPVYVRMTGMVRGDERGPGIAAVNAPTTAEATAALHRAARVNGAENVVGVSSDYRRAAMAGGTTATQWRIEVQAWGTAIAMAKQEASDTTAKEDPQEADRKAKAVDRDAKARSADAVADAARTDAEARQSRAMESEMASALHADSPPVSAAAPVPAEPVSPTRREAGHNSQAR